MMMMTTTTKATLVAVLLSALLAPSLTFAYALRKNAKGKSVLWKHRQVVVALDTKLVDKVGGAADAVRAAFVTWTSFGVPVKIALTEAKGKTATARDGKNVVRWGRDDWPYGKEVVAMTVAWYNASTGLTSETDIILNARDHGWGVLDGRPSSKHDIQNVLTHEAGHFFGLGHSADAHATMYATTPAAETAKRHLTHDDRQGIGALIEAMKTLPDDVGQEPGEPRSQERGRGCSMGRTYGMGGWPVLVVLLGLVGLGARRRSWILSTALLLTPILLTPPGAANATVIRGLSLEQLANRASTVVEGRIIQARPVLARGLIFTEYQVRSTRYYKGARGATLTVRVPGGEIDGQGMHVEGAPRLRTGQRVILFGRWSERRLVLVGLTLGAFVLRGDLAFRDLTGVQLRDGKRMTQRGWQTISVSRLTKTVARTLQRGQ